MSTAQALALGFLGSLSSFGLAVLCWGEWGSRHLPSWVANYPVLVAFLVLNVSGWVVGMIGVAP